MKHIAFLCLRKNVESSPFLSDFKPVTQTNEIQNSDKPVYQLLKDVKTAKVEANNG